ncbi:MAG TPA: inverse autotransporter beta domain-containing protein [Kiritimatiellia bacterium]|nr:inverse autotransporter beta domain-containing protein [Kiritimatiellia bacterium]
MSARWVRSLLVVLVLFSFGLSSAHAAKSKAKTKAKEAPPPAAVETESAGLPPAELSVGFQVRDSETEGLGDLLVPVWNPGGTGLLFLNPRTAIVDHDEQEGNLGIGYRQLLPRLDVILGANLYYDYRDTGSFNYDQWGFGLELLSPWIDARAKLRSRRQAQRGRQRNPDHRQPDGPHLVRLARSVRRGPLRPPRPRHDPHADDDDHHQDLRAI